MTWCRAFPELTVCTMRETAQNVNPTKWHTERALAVLEQVD